MPHTTIWLDGTSDEKYKIISQPAQAMLSRSFLQTTILLLLCFAPTLCFVCNASNPYLYNGACFPQCPWNTTITTYLYTSNNSCEVSCGVGSFADDVAKKCVTTCPSTPIQTYYDTVYHRCVKNCSTDPAYFAYIPTKTCVQYCISPTWADENQGLCVNVCPVNTYYQVDGSERTCVKICYPNSYADLTRTCVAATSCPSTPVAMYGDDKTGLCVADCPLNTSTYAEDSTRKCVLYCSLGTFADPTTRKCVSVCPFSPLYYGSNITRNCLLTCNEGQFSDETIRQCTLKCSTGLYGDYSSQRCMARCPYNQSTFADPLTNLCVPICPANSYADNYTRSCVAAIACSNQTLGDPVTQKCVPAKNCSAGFFADVGTNLCVIRCTNWGNPISNFCEDVCPWNPPLYSYYKDPSTNICVQTCPVNPRYFGDNSTRSCVTTCPAGSIGSPVTMKCVLTCPDGFYANTVTNVCVANCTQNTTSILYFFKPNLTCLSACPLNYYADNATLTCVVVCTNDTYAYGPQRTCVSDCPDGYFGDSYSQSCVTSCPIQNGQYADPSTNLCVDICPQTPDYYGQDINDGNKTCVASCSLSGFFADPLTRRCIYNCNTTAGYFGYLTDKRCWERCPTGYGDFITKRCVASCPRHPKFFFGDNLTATCVLRCPEETYGDKNNNLCVYAPNCTAGTFGDDSSGLCVAVCSELLKLFGDPANQKCVYVCTYPNYADPTTRRCEASCDSTAKLFKDPSNKVCVQNCSSMPDLFNDPNTMTCQYNCTAGYGLAYGNTRKCVDMCPSTPPYLADLQSLMCVEKCANGTFKFINNTFRGCVFNCPPQVFNGTLSIDLFSDNTTWTCVQVCPYGFYAFTHPSDATIRTCVRYCQMVGTTYYFAEDQTRKCVSSCPMIHYGTYGDKIDFRCAKTCSRNQYRDNATGLCTYQCTPGTFANNVTWNCSSWCEQGWFAESINYTCVKTCPTGLFGYLKICRDQCPNGTYFYNDNTTWLCVDKCPAYPNYFADDNYLACVLVCYPGYYADTATRKCLPAINCSDTTIADPISKRCVFQCTKQPMYYLTIQTNLCGSTCSNGQFAYNQTNMCIQECPPPYFGVNSTTHYYCAQYCPTGEFMWINGTTRMCITSCPQHLYRDQLTMSCVEVCPDYAYSNDSNTKCILSCAPLYADDQNKTCVQVCPNDTTASNNSFKCQSQCDYGEFSYENVCYSTCPDGYFADNLTRTCVTECPNDPLTYADTFNKRCVFTCSAAEYAFLENLTCLDVCPEGYFKQLTLLLCINPCLQGFFSDSDTYTCVTSCSLSKYNYSDPTTQSCVETCPSDPDLYGHNYQCLTQCPLGTFAQNSTRRCVTICPNASNSTTPIRNESWADDLTRRCLKRCSSLSFAFTNITHNVCLNICPSFFYASIADQACVTQCPEGTYAHNSSTTCVDQCPPGQWADLVLRICMPDCTYNTSLFADDSTNTCVERCPTYPDLYADPTTHKCVLSCPTSHYAYNITRQCVTDCPYPYFADLYSLQCVLHCPLSQLTFADSVLRKCTPSCANHTINLTLVQFYQDNSTLQCVQQCPEFPEKYYGQNLTNTCMQSCPTGTYGDNDTRVCLDKCVFEDPKFTWQDKNENFCVTVCPYGYYADNKTGSCEINCTAGTFADNSTRRCVYDCPIDPASYSATIDGVGRCVYNCPNGTYSSEATISCVSICPLVPFVYYTYPPTNACVRQCVYPYFADLETKACTQTCKIGYYGNLTTKVCEICQIQCVTCQGYLVCTSCIVGFYLYENTCVISCPSYPIMYYAHKQAGVCYKTCPIPFFGEVTTQLCQLICPALSYQNNVTRTCMPCPTGCITCSLQGCYTCSSGYTFLPSALICNKNCNDTAVFYFNSKCYKTCPSGSYLSYDLVHCLACSSPCATCVGSSGNCTSCINSYYYIGKCLDACPSNFFIDTKLNCVACSSKPERCILPPLTYSFYPFTANFKLNSYVVFNRAVNLTIAEFITTVQIKYNGQSVKSSQYTASVYNKTTFLVVFNNANSLNQNSLSFNFAPGAISDQFGNVLTVVTVTQTITLSTGVNSQISQINDSVSKSTKAISWILLIVLGLFFIKSGYPALIAIEVLQIIYMHIFLLTNPLPFLEYNFLDILKYFHFMFLPSLFESQNITTPIYSLFSTDLSYLSNSPIIIVFAFVITTFLLVLALSSKRLIKNKAVRKLFKKIRKYRVKYGLIHDAFWVTYLYALFISMLQFKMGSFGTTMGIVNMMLSIITFLLMLIFTIFMFYLGYKYRKEPQDKIPKKYSFLTLEPSTFSLEMPMRYARKFLLALALLLGSLQSQAVMMIMINIVFLSFYACYKPAKSVMTNRICIFIQIGYILLEGLFIGYDKLITKDISSQLGFSIAMMVVQGLLILVVLIWSAYRLGLIIKESQTWKKISNKIHENNDPEYLKEQQRKRDLQFDFGSLQNRSQDERTDNLTEKQSIKYKKADEKYNIFQIDNEEEGMNDLQKPQDLPKSLKSINKSNRPITVQSHEKMALKSINSEQKGSYFGRKSSHQERRSKNHLQIQKDDTIERIQSEIEQIVVKDRKAEDASIKHLIEEPKKPEKVLWEDIDFDENEI